MPGSMSVSWYAADGFIPIYNQNNNLSMKSSAEQKDTPNYEKQMIYLVGYEAEFDKEWKERLKFIEFYEVYNCKIWFIFVDPKTHSVASRGNEYNFTDEKNHKDTCGWLEDTNYKGSKLMHIPKLNRFYTFMWTNSGVALAIYYFELTDDAICNKEHEDKTWVYLPLKGSLKSDEFKRPKWKRRVFSKVYDWDTYPIDIIAVGDIYCMMFNWAYGGLIHVINLENGNMWTHEKRLSIESFRVPKKYGLIQSVCYDKWMDIVHFFVYGDEHKITNLKDLIPPLSPCFDRDIVIGYIRGLLMNGDIKFDYGVPLSFYELI